MPIDRTTAAVISETAQSNIFDFFGLPRELRDWVYGYEFEDRTTPRDERDEGNKWNYRARIPLVNARLISQQLMSEYDEMSGVHHLLRMEDHPDVLMDQPGSLAILAWFKKTVDFEIAFLVTWCGDNHEPRNHYHLDERTILFEHILVDFTTLEKLKITIFFVKRPGASIVWDHIQSNFVYLSKLRCLRQVKVVGVVPGPLGSEENSDTGSSDGEDSDSEESDGTRMTARRQRMLMSRSSHRTAPQIASTLTTTRGNLSTKEKSGEDNRSQKW
ncbi:hypothetical protein B0A48_18097 [Cryoendolithus antarcticus]|uniref:Uncharacterized protein n=1 Tax=Cryoendolithus antarcticus TaxID=1507870 RepID=A0A1V8S9K9_9PEZI|nr:hypothetical protein B0A48_18097 [Cryoendolithus antarcticus]